MGLCYRNLIFPSQKFLIRSATDHKPLALTWEDAVNGKKIILNQSNTSK